MKHTRLFPILLCVSVFSVVSPVFSSSIDNGAGATNRSSSNAWLTCAFISTNETNASLTIYYGTGDGTNSAGSWSTNVSLGNCPTGLRSAKVSGLAPTTLYYYRAYATAATSHWSTVSTSFWTTARVPTNPPAIAALDRAVMATPAGILAAPTNFFDANGIPLSSSLPTATWNQAAADAIDATNRIKAIELNTSTWSTASTTSISATQQIAVIQAGTQAWNQAATAASNTAWHINGDNAPTAGMNGGNQAFTNMGFLRGPYGYWDFSSGLLGNRVAGVDYQVFSLYYNRAYAYDALHSIQFDWAAPDLIDFQDNEIRTTGYLTGKVVNPTATNDPANKQYADAGDSTLQGNINLVSNKLTKTTFSLFMPNPTNGTYNTAFAGYLQYPVTITNIVIRGTNAVGDLLRCGFTNTLNAFTLVYTGATADTVSGFTNITGLGIQYAPGDRWGFRMTNGSTDNLQIECGASW